MTSLSSFHTRQSTRSHAHRHWFAQIGLSVLAAVVLCLGRSSGAEAQDAKTFPGTFCQANGSAQNLYYGTSEIANRTDSSQSVICPIVRDSVAQPWQWLAVRVRDRHDTQDITCVAHSQDVDGTTVWMQSRSTVGEGFATLFFDVPLEADFGTYTLVCLLPPMQDVNQPSYLSTYALQEP